jgi:hypothetical protein
MENDKKTLLILGLIVAGFLGAFIIGDFVVNVVADRVIEKIMNEPGAYSPYGPRANPDKYPFQKLERKTQLPQQTQYKVPNVEVQEPYRATWEDDWNLTRSNN